MNPHKMDFHQRAVPSPMERKDKCSPRRMITMRASALTQIKASFKTAEANVASGTKNTNTWRIATIAKSEMVSPAHVAGETFVGRDGCSGVRANDAPILSVSMISIRMRKGAVWIQEKMSRFYGGDSCWQARRLPYKQTRQRRRNRPVANDALWPLRCASVSLSSWLGCENAALPKNFLAS